MLESYFILKKNFILQDDIFIKPKIHSSYLSNVLGQKLFGMYDVKIYNRYTELSKEYSSLNKLKERYEKIAQRRSYYVFGASLVYLIFQFSILARMVWIDYSWGVMEPVSYFVGLGTMIIGLTFFAALNQEYTYNNFFDTVRKKFLRRIYIKNKFNWKKWNKLHQEITTLKSYMTIDQK